MIFLKGPSLFPVALSAIDLSISKLENDRESLPTPEEKRKLPVKSCIISLIDSTAKQPLVHAYTTPRFTIVNYNFDADRSPSYQKKLLTMVAIIHLATSNLLACQPQDSDAKTHKPETEQQSASSAYFILNIFRG